MPILGRILTRSLAGSKPKTLTSPPSRLRYPSRISTTVVLPRAVGSEQREDLARVNIQVNAAHARTAPYDLTSPRTRTAGEMSDMG